MKLTLKKIGRIDHAQIDIRPLTVFIGPNGTNKTWTAYSLYGLLRSMSPGPETVLRLGPDSEKDADAEMVHTRLEQLLGSLIDAINAEKAPDRVMVTIDVQELLLGTQEEWSLSLATKLLAELLGRDETELESAEASLTFIRREFAQAATLVDVLLEPSTGNLSLRIQRREVEDLQFQIRAKAWTKKLLLNTVWSHIFSLIDRLVVFPAERKGLLIAMDRLSQKGEATLLPAHADFLAFARLGRTVRPSNNPNKKEPLAPYLNHLLGGEIVFGAAGGEGPLVLRLANGQSIPIESASSLGRAVAGLSLYINHFVRPNDVLIFDELEMNAHPEAQMGLVELIAMLVNRGVRVVVTTHSPYIVDHLNNIMEAAHVPAERQGDLAKKFHLGSSAAFLSSEKVACHAFEETSPGGPVTVRDVLDRASGLIDWRTFSHVTERMSNLYNDVLKATV